MSTATANTTAKSVNHDTTTPATASVPAVPSSPPALPPKVTLAGKVAIVTGASRGIGAAIALSLARDGAKVVVNYNVDKKSADGIVTTINSHSSNSSTINAIAVQGDVSKSDDVDRLFAEAKRVFGRVDIVVANSGTGGASTIASTTNDEFDRLIGINLKGVFYTLRAAANAVENNGRIIVIGSSTKNGLLPGYGAYAATKGAVEVLSNTLAQELGGKGITVNTIHPGPIDTDLMRAAGEAAMSYVATLSPQKRIGQPNDIGDAVALLASESSRWISGQAIMLHGGAK